MTGDGMRGRGVLRSWLPVLAASCLWIGPGCVARRPAVAPALTAAANSGDVLALSDALEDLIGAGRDTLADRQYAYRIAAQDDGDSAAALYARAAVTGRLVQAKGLLAANLVPEIERCARRSRELDPNFRDGAATRLLGTLYVLAPAALLHHGDSEIGVDLLEELVRRHPEVPENHLRLAEAYIALHDPQPAGPHLCRCLDEAAALRPDDRRLLRALIDSAGPPACAPHGAAAH